MVIRQFDVYLVKLDPAVGREIRKTRPCVVVTPTDVNRFTQTVLAAPMTSTLKGYPCRVECNFAGRRGSIALEQIRCVDRSRLVKHLGRMDHATQAAISESLLELFSPTNH